MSLKNECICVQIELNISDRPWQKAMSLQTNLTIYIKTFVNIDETLLLKFKEGKKNLTCWNLMCKRECKSTFTDENVIDILLYVNKDQIREYILQFLTDDIKILQTYLVTLV